MTIPPTPPAMTDAEVAEPRVCRSDYHADTGIVHHPGMHTRIINCRLPEGHDGDHDELLDGEPGLVRWPRRKPTPYLDEPRSLLDAARAEIKEKLAIAEKFAAENARLRERGAAAEERYTRLVGEVEAIAATIRPRTWSNPVGQALADVADRLRSALAAAAPQTAPPTTRQQIQARLDELRSAPQTGPAQPPCGHRSGIHDEHCDVVNDPGQDEAEELDEAIAGAMGALDWAANHISLAYEHLKSVRRGLSEPTAADPEPVRVTAGTEATAIVREAIEDSANQDDEGSMWLVEADFPAAADRIIRWLREAGWTLLPPAHTAGDEHLQDLRQDLTEVLALDDDATTADDASIVERVRQLVTTELEYHHVRRERDQFRADLEAIRRNGADLIEALSKAERDAAEARREADRLTGDNHKIAEQYQRELGAHVRLRAEAKRTAGYFANEQKAARTVGNDGIADVLAHVVDEIRALAGHGDTTAGGGGQ